MGENNVKTKKVKARIPKGVICPTCGMKQKFKKKKEQRNLVKDINVNVSVLLRMVYAKCLNPDCAIGSFALPIPGIKKRARATTG
jgi:hypothetical protein